MTRRHYNVSLIDYSGNCAGGSQSHSVQKVHKDGAGLKEVTNKELYFTIILAMSEDFPTAKEPEVKLDGAQTELHDQPSDAEINEIAKRLLKWKFLLSALEVHVELCERGREQPLLRDFFSNPGNFESNTRYDGISIGGISKFSFQTVPNNVKKQPHKILAWLRPVLASLNFHLADSKA